MKSLPVGAESDFGKCPQKHRVVEKIEKKEASVHSRTQIQKVIDRQWIAPVVTSTNTRLDCNRIGIVRKIVH